MQSMKQTRIVLVLCVVAVTINQTLSLVSSDASACCRRRRFLHSLTLPFLAPGWCSWSSNAVAAEYATSAGRKGCSTVSDPSKTVVVCRGGLANLTASELRLNGIASTENGVSTSAVKNPARYTAPWSYLTETSDPSKAWESLKDAVQQQQATIVDERLFNNKVYYLHAVAPTKTPPGLPTDESGLDDLEFLLRPDDNLVLYRSASRAAVFVYPLTQPVGDGDSNLLRLERIRSILGWQKLE